MPRDFTASGGSEAPLRSTGHAWSTISQMASPVPGVDGVPSLRMAKNDELSSESDAIESTEGTTLAARFQALLSVAESISSCREPEELFGRLAAELQRVVRFDFVGASCYDHERGVVRSAMLETGSTALVPREEMVAKETPHAIVIESQQPLIVSDTGAETRWPERMAMIRNDGIGSFCVLPLTTIHTRLGTLGFARRDRATYTDAEVQFMGEVAKLVAVAIENAMAFGEIGRLKDKLAEERLYLESEIRNEQSFEHIIGDSPALRRTLQQVEIVAPTDSTVLPLGETGTVEEQRFRDDLYYRLNVFPIQAPPLRERPEDIPALVSYFVQRFARPMNRRVEVIPSETLDALRRYTWPGNIRELANLIERAMILSRGRRLEVARDDLARRRGSAPIGHHDTAGRGIDRADILRALAPANWVLGGPRGTAARLGMKRTTLQSLMKRLGIEKPA